MRHVLISQNLRLLEKNTRVTLGHAAGQSIPAGTMVTLGEPEEYWYDHRVQIAFPVVEFPGKFILERDIDQPYLLTIEKTNSQQTVH
jgi:hypothetical protein